MTGSQAASSLFNSVLELIPVAIMIDYKQPNHRKFCAAYNDGPSLNRGQHNLGLAALFGYDTF